MRVALASRGSACEPARLCSGRGSGVRPLGQREVRFSAAGRRVVCIAVLARAQAFTVSPPLGFTLAWRYGDRPDSRPLSRRSVTRQIRVTP